MVSRDVARDAEEACSRDQLVLYIRADLEDMAPDSDAGMVRMLRELQKGDKSAHPVRTVTAKSLLAAFPNESIMTDRAAEHFVQRCNRHVRMSVSRIFSRFDHEGQGEINRAELAGALQQAKPDVWDSEHMNKMLANICQESSGAIDASAADLKEGRLEGKPGGPVRHGQFLRWALSGDAEAAEVVQVVAGSGPARGIIGEPMQKPERQKDGRWYPLPSPEMK
eukprot:TRINITY_DN37505_c0_g1_i1.p1 TRINITY_DN37505_c0_g1~~TRINITY_DN37505_c0_g1_i1.p1  ORF type:complete len:223 (+),score=60.63 TRINITY_DN37505_c0_g1_i1:66-734(+)